MKNHSRKIMSYVALALVCVLAGTVIGTNLVSAGAEVTEKVVLTSPYTDAIAQVRDSVVGVNNYQIVSNSGYGSDFFGFGYGYGYGYGYGMPYGYGNGQDSGREIHYGSGSGVVVAKEYVLTNYHVIEGSSSLKICLNDEADTTYDATVAAFDEAKDVAVLYVPGLELEPVKLGDSDNLQVGDWVVNIGNAIGFTRTATAGIVSALDREIKSDSTTTDRFGRKSNATNTMIQTDAAINSGNSGGGMFNTAGELVGIPTLKYSGSRYNGATIESIGMCIPINEAKPVIEEALNGEKPETDTTAAGTEDQPNEEPEVRNDRLGKPRFGVSIQTLQGAALTNGALPNGAYVISVEKDSPAEKAGILPGDMIVEINGAVVATSDDMMNALADTKAGDVMTVTVWRPDEVYDAERGSFTYAGKYVEGIQVTLAILEETSNT